jgi:hypothetical protein
VVSGLKDRENDLISRAISHDSVGNAGDNDKEMLWRFTSKSDRAASAISSSVVSGRSANGVLAFNSMVDTRV